MKNTLEDEAHLSSASLILHNSDERNTNQQKSVEISLNTLIVSVLFLYILVHEWTELFTKYCTTLYT
jgi:hypothetical protein